ncbi:carboxypeptidase-like regulatory domain-containing protein [Primorskyibacter sp. 2E107]|uniref:carboxypeptidase-like regulatory domain-containing protein n=1 Tax=Primorskyibacter sp. 2E107 TaxID=3403458 RepID=UPI003AF8D5FC
MARKNTLDPKDFKSPIDLDTLANGLNTLPQLTDAMRIAGMRDGAGFARAKAISAERAALRAKLAGDSQALSRAEKAMTDATALETALDREVQRVETGLAAVLNPDGGKPTAKSRFALSGCVMTSKGAPAAGAVVVLRYDADETPVRIETDEGGRFAIDLPVGTGKGKVPDGATLMFEVALGERPVRAGHFPTVVVTGGGAQDVVLTLPKPSDQTEQSGSGSGCIFSPDAQKAKSRLARLTSPWDLFKD